MTPGSPIQLSPAEKAARAKALTGWQYVHDLGDGVFTAPEQPGIQSWHELRKAIIVAQLGARFPGGFGGRTVLDVGCNSGFWSVLAADLGAASVLGLDVAPRFLAQAELVQACRNRPNVRFVRSDILAFQGGPFDIVLCLGLLYHVTDHVGIARRLRAVTAGILVVDTSISPSLSPTLELAEPGKFFGYAAGEFAFVPSASAVREILRHAGFASVERWPPSPGSAAYETNERALFFAWP